MNAAVFLDRDNTLIHNDGDLGDPALVKLIQGAASAIASLRGLNYKIIVVSNQGGVARGKYTEEDVQKTNQRVADLVKAASGATIDRFYYCPYHPQGTVPQYTSEHDWRKPSPGMLLQAASDMQIDLSQSWMVGDQMRDVQAGIAAGTRAILLRPDAQELTPLRSDQIKSGRLETSGDLPHFTARNMIEAVRIIAQQRKPEVEIEPAKKKWDAAAAKAARESRTEQSKPSAEPATRSPTSPASASDSSAVPGATGRTAATKPFRPWGAAERDNPASASTPASPVSTATPAAPAKIETVPTAAPAQEPATKDVARAVAADIAHANSAGDAEDAGVGVDHDSAGPRPPAADVTLRQILQELRGQRHVHNDFSYVRMIAIVMQIVAGFLLLAGLLLGADDLDAFVRWIATAILVQLAAIAMLLLDR